ncbi:MAG: hypothetical protein C4336_02370 [Armatimonadota bacterium]
MRNYRYWHLLLGTAVGIIGFVAVRNLTRTPDHGSLTRAHEATYPRQTFYFKTSEGFDKITPVPFREPPPPWGHRVFRFSGG